jgi:UDP-3-O-[3-hydroxymyristoyl] glucosamine N-acyltransferase
MFAGVAPLQEAGQRKVSFLDSRRYALALEYSMAGSQMQARVPRSAIAIVTASAYEGWARVAALFHPVYIYPGACVGQEGFSFATTSIPQLGRVIVEDDVEVGANSTIDRGSTRDTLIGAGTRIDHLVQIGQDVRLGRCCVIVARVGIDGSTILEDFVQVGGQAAMAGHLRVGHGSQIGASAGVISDVPVGSVMLGYAARPRNEFFRQVATRRRLDGRPG